MNESQTLQNNGPARGPGTLLHSRRFLRHLSSFEELVYQMDKNHPLHAILAAQVDGPTTLDQWRVALEQLRMRHPLWSVVMAGKKDEPLYFGNAIYPEIGLRIVQGDFSRNWEQEVARELSITIDTKDSPLVRAVLLHTGSTCMLILSAHHSICDGMSLALRCEICSRCCQDLL